MWWNQFLENLLTKCEFWTNFNTKLNYQIILTGKSVQLCYICHSYSDGARHHYNLYGRWSWYVRVYTDLGAHCMWTPVDGTRLWTPVCSHQYLNGNIEVLMCNTCVDGMPAYRRQHGCRCKDAGEWAPVYGHRGIGVSVGDNKNCKWDGYPVGWTIKHVRFRRARKW